MVRDGQRLLDAVTQGRQALVNGGSLRWDIRYTVRRHGRDREIYFLQGGWDDPAALRRLDPATKSFLAALEAVLPERDQKPGHAIKPLGAADF